MYADLWIILKLLGFAPPPKKFKGNLVFKVPQNGGI